MTGQPDHSRRAWVRLDNASNIFLAAMSSVDTKVFRLSAELDHEVDPALLQQALDVVYDQHVLYHSVLRRGIFWYYLEQSDLRPTVGPEVLPPCDYIYHYDRRELLFRVLHHGNRIVLEVLHALADGTGASWVLRDLITEYLRLRHPDEGLGADAERGAGHGLVPDSFSVFHPREPALFAQAARPAALEASDQIPEQSGEPSSLTKELFGTRRRRVYRIKGQLTPDHRTRIIEVKLPVDQVLPLAREQQVSLTVWLTALFLHSIREVDGRKDVVLGAVNRLNNRNLTVAMTNIGRVGFPKDVDAQVGAVHLAVSAARPQFSLASHGNVLTLNFTSPFVDTAHQTAFVRELTSQGVEVSLAVSKVTADELDPAPVAVGR